MDIHKKWDLIKDRLKGFIKKNVRDEDLSKDLLQQVYLQAAQNSNSIKNQNKIDSWLYRIAKNVVTDHFRAETRKRSIDVAILKSSIHNEEAPLFHHEELSSCLHPMLNNLHEYDRYLLVNIDLLGISQKSLAEQLKIAYPTMKSKVQRARKKLKNEFLKCCRIKSDAYGNILNAEEKNICSCH